MDFALNDEQADLVALARRILVDACTPIRLTEVEAGDEWFDRSTWASVGGHGDPAAATPGEQDYRAQLLYDLVGKGAWPSCGRSLP